MAYRRLFIMRKDLNMSHGKLGAQIGHCAEAYWTRLLKNNLEICDNGMYRVNLEFPGNGEKELFDEYLNGVCTKTICEAKNKGQLMKAKDMALAEGLVEGVDFGLIYDRCFTELEPEEEDGTTLTGIWFRPLPDDVAHKISKKFQLYRG